MQAVESLYINEQIDQSLFGSDRIGGLSINKRVSTLIPTQIAQLNLGSKQFELKNHLGNVLVTVSDYAKPKASGTEFTATLLTANDYYPFGMIMPGRSFGKEYRFGFQGQEKDDEISGQTGSHLSYKYRIHDARIGRFLSVDPLTPTYPHNSPYAFSENRVIDGVELEGLEVYLTNREWSSGGGFGQFGYGYVKGTGVAKDDVGSTYFKYKKPTTKINDNESIMGISLITLKRTIGVDFASNTFEEHIKKGPITSIEAAPGILNSIDGRDDLQYWGASFGVGVGFTYSTFATKITESVSLTNKDEAEIMKQFKESGCLMTSEDKPGYFIEDRNGENYLGYELPRSLFGLGLIDTSVKIKTDIKMNNISEDSDSKRWQSESYQKGVEELK